MLFNSFEFLALVLATFVVYYLPRNRKWQIPVLIAASFIFYGSHEAVLTLLLACSILINATASHKVRSGHASRQTYYAAAGVIANLLLLAFFKYSPLFSKTFLNQETELAETLLLIPLPIGISFFTFQGISLLIDTAKERRGEIVHVLPNEHPLRHFLNITFYISFFPQLVAGPIVKAHDFLPQIKEKLYRDIDWDYCFRALVTGYFLKMVVADNLKDHTFWIAFPYYQNKASIELIIMLFGYSMQIFADFAGYSLIAIGIAGLFGYRLPQNFNFPYISRSITEFWRRWHISLSSFLKEYLYIPLGGNRRGKYRTYINLMIVMLLGGLWHGAAWSYMVWGGFHGIMLATERFASKYIPFPDYPAVKFMQIVATFILVSLAWLLFKLPEFSHVIGYLEAITTNLEFPLDYKNIYSIFIYSLPVLGYHALHLIRGRNLNWERYSASHASAAAYGLMTFFIVTNSGPQTDFIYFQF